MHVLAQVQVPISSSDSESDEEMAFRPGKYKQFCAPVLDSIYRYVLHSTVVILVH